MRKDANENNIDEDKEICKTNNRNGSKNGAPGLHVIGNLRRQLRDQFEPIKSLNIEKQKMQNGQISDDESDSRLRKAPSLESVSEPAKNIKEHIKRVESFQKHQKRS